MITIKSKNKLYIKALSIFIVFMLIIPYININILTSAEEIGTSRNISVFEVEGNKKTGMSIKRGRRSKYGASGTRLSVGDTATTDAKTTSRMQADTDKVLVMDKSSIMNLSKATKDTISISVVSGKIYFEVKNKLTANSFLSFQSGGSTMGVRGTSGTIENKYGAINLLIFSGKVEVVDSNDNKIIIKAGEYATLDKETKKVLKITPIEVEQLDSFTLKILLDVLAANAETDNEKEEQFEVSKLLGIEGNNTNRIDEFKRLFETKMLEENTNAENIEAERQRILTELNNQDKITSTIPELLDNDIPKVPDSNNQISDTNNNGVDTSDKKPKDNSEKKPETKPIDKNLIYHITYDLNGPNAKPPIDLIQYSTGDVATVQNLSDKYEGYEFVKWNTSPDGTGISYSENEILTIADKDIKLYAIWKKTKVVALEPEITKNIGGSISYSLDEIPEPLTINAKSKDNGTLTYQWYVAKEQKASNNQDISNKSSGGTLIVGATSNTYTPHTKEKGIYHYYAVITNTKSAGLNSSNAKITSGIITIEIVDKKINAKPPVISTNLSGSFKYTKGDFASSLNVLATTADEGEISYQWFVSPSANNTTGTPISGVVGTTYTPSTATVGTTFYYVEITNTNKAATGEKKSILTTGVVEIVVEEPVVSVPPVVIPKGSKENPFVIGTVDQLRAFRDLVNNPTLLRVDVNGASTRGTNKKQINELLTNDFGYEYSSDKPTYFKLGRDIDMGNQIWEPIGNNDSPFRGGFDGGGYTISNINIQLNTDNGLPRGFFGIIDTEYDIVNLTLSNINVLVSEGGTIGAFAGSIRNANNISNCKVVDSDITINHSVSGSKSLVGYFAGEILATNNITNCIVSNVDFIETAENAGSSIVGGFAARVTASNLQMINTSVTVPEITMSGSKIFEFGGFIAELDVATSSNSFVIAGCKTTLNHNTIANQNSGGFIAKITGMKNADVIDLVNGTKYFNNCTYVSTTLPAISNIQLKLNSIVNTNISGSNYTPTLKKVEAPITGITEETTIDFGDIVLEKSGATPQTINWNNYKFYIIDMSDNNIFTDLTANPIEFKVKSAEISADNIYKFTSSIYLNTDGEKYIIFKNINEFPSSIVKVEHQIDTP